MAPLRILHVTPYFSDAWAYGGIPRLATTLTRGLARLGHRVTVCTTDACDEISRVPAGERSTREGVTIRTFPNFSNRMAYRLQFFLPVGLNRYLKQHAAAFDVAHLHACRNVPGVIAARHLRRAGVPYVLAPNGTAALIERRHLAKRGFDLLVGADVMKHAARVLAVSEVERLQLESLGVPASAIRCIPNPVDLEEFARPVERGKFRRRFAVAPGPVVMFLGKMTPRKRLDVLVRSVAWLKRPDVRLVIAGNDMGAEPDVRALIGALGLESQVVFTGLLRGEQRLEALADADVAVYPSQDEIFGLVPLEAVLSGTPVIVADDSGCAEVVRAVRGGLVTPVGDAERLTEAIRGVLDDPGRWRSIAAGAAARVRALFGDQLVCERVARMYSEIVGGV